MSTFEPVPIVGSGNDNGNGSPWWVKAIYQFGVPAGIAMFLVYRLTVGLPTAADVAEVKSTLAVHVSQTNEELVDIRLLLRAICFNTADNEKSRAACQAGGGR